MGKFIVFLAIIAPSIYLTMKSYQLIASELFNVNLSLGVCYLISLVLSGLRYSPLKKTYEIKEIETVFFLEKALSALIMDILNYFVLIPWLIKLLI